jgi:hypothetical protein
LRGGGYDIPHLIRKPYIPILKIIPKIIPTDERLVRVGLKILSIINDDLG